MSCDIKYVTIRCQIGDTKVWLQLTGLVSSKYYVDDDGYDDDDGDGLGDDDDVFCKIM